MRPKAKRLYGSVYQSFGEAVRLTRLRRGMTQAELAAWVRLSRGSIANIETGRQRVLLHDLLVFARALRVRPRDLLPLD